VDTGLGIIRVPGPLWDTHGAGRLGPVTPRNETESTAARKGLEPILWAMSGSPVLLLIVILMGVGIGMRFYGMSRRRRFSGGGAGRPAPGPEEILARRFANGEISEDEYQRRLTALRQNRPPS
jgi:putative membrane protein